MNNLHHIYLKETSGRKISYTAWLELNLTEFAAAYDGMMKLAQEAHHLLKYGSEAERLRLADEIAVVFKDTGLFDHEQPAPPAAEIESISDAGLITLNHALQPGESLPAIPVHFEDKLQ